MKKSFLLVIAFCAIKLGYSQTEQGKMFIGGQVSFLGNSQSQLDNQFKLNIHSNSFTLTPTFGYFIKDHLAIGVNVTYSYLNLNQTDGNLIDANLSYNYKSTTIGYGIGGFVRYYSDITDKFKFFLHGGFSYLNTEQKSTSSTSVNRDFITNSTTFSIAPGLVYFVTPKFGIQTTFGNLFYSINKAKTKDSPYDNHDNSNPYGLNLNPATFSLGLCYYF